MKDRLLFIYNPCAGKGTIRYHLANLIEQFTAAGYEVTVHPTSARMDARQTAMEYALEQKCERIICAGGDGTFAETAGGLLQCGSKLPLGFLPVGTTNDFASSLGLQSSLKKAADTALHGTVVPSDIGTINGMPFTYSASFGLFSDVTYETSQNTKNILGRTAYILNGAMKLRNIRYYHLVAEGDGFAIEDDFILGMVANSNSVGGFKGITGKHVELDDGFFEMLFIRKPKNLLVLNEIINALLTNELENCPYICYERVSRLKVTTGEELSWALDGEFGGDLRSAEILIHKQKLCYVTGSKTNPVFS